MDWLARDYRHLWHPFTQYDEWITQENLVIERGEGAYLYDLDGKRYLDGVSSLWCNVHGHRHPRIDAAVRDQLERIAHTTMLGLTHRPGIELAERLAKLTGLPRVFYSDSGSTAVEVALKMAFQACQQRGETKRVRFAALTDAYHGDTVGSVSVGGIELFHSIYRPLLFDAVRVPIDQAAEVLAEHGPTLCAFIYEPLVQGAAGMKMHSAEALAAACGAAREAGAYLIADEVATGFGRTGKMFASVDRDFLCVAKGLTGGYLPLAATLTTEAVHDCFRGDYTSYRTFFHGHTYTGNPLACAAALATLDVFDEERTLERMQPSIGAMGSVLQKWRGPMRQLGLMAAMDLPPLPPEARAGHRIALACRERGVILRNLGDTLVLMPPLCITPAQTVELVTTVREVSELYLSSFPRPEFPMDASS